MHIQNQINNYISNLPELKQCDIRELHNIIQRLMPGCRLWFLDGKDDNGKVVSNPNIGYGVQTITYADGKIKEFYQIGLSGNTTGISVYIMGIKDKNYLPSVYGKIIGKAKVTGYCIKFKSIKDINTDVLKSMINDRLANL